MSQEGIIHAARVAIASILIASKPTSPNNSKVAFNNEKLNQEQCLKLQSKLHSHIPYIDIRIIFKIIGIGDKVKLLEE